MEFWIFLCIHIFILPLGLSSQSSSNHFVKLRNVNNSIANNYSSVASLKIQLRQELIMEFFSKVALEELKCPINCTVNLSDIAAAAQLSKYSTPTLVKAIGKLKLNNTIFYQAVMNCNMTVNTTAYYLELFQTSFSEIYNNFVSSLSNPVELIPKVLKILNVSSTAFTTAIAYGNDITRLQVLSNGNYSLSNIKAVLNVTNKNFTDMIGFIPLNRVFDQLGKVNASTLLRFVKDLNLTSEYLSNFYIGLNISSTDFLKYKKITTIVESIYNFLNKEELLGVFISRTLLATVNKAKAFEMFYNRSAEFTKRYAQFSIYGVRNLSQYHEVKNITLSHHGKYSKGIAIVETTTPFYGKIARISSVHNTSKLVNCTYVSKFNNGSLFMEQMGDAQVKNESASVMKSNRTIYNLGSPIFCQQKLYGLAVEDYPKYINFTYIDLFNTTVKPETPDIVHEKNTTSKPNLSNMQKSNIAITMLGTLILLNRLFV